MPDRKHQTLNLQHPKAQESPEFFAWRGKRALRRPELVHRREASGRLSLSVVCSGGGKSADARTPKPRPNARTCRCAPIESLRVALLGRNPEKLFVVLQCLVDPSKRCRVAPHSFECYFSVGFHVLRCTRDTSTVLPDCHQNQPAIIQNIIGQPLDSPTVRLNCDGDHLMVASVGNCPIAHTPKRAQVLHRRTVDRQNLGGESPIILQQGSGQGGC